MIQLFDNRRCFACGPDNPIGLRLEFQHEGDTVRAAFTPRPEHQGYAGITHGGILATVLDEAMARLLWDQGIHVVTASFEMRLRRPAPADEELQVKASRQSSRGRMITCVAELTDGEGNVVAEARGSYLRVKD